MEQKKEASSRKIAIIHFLFAGVGGLLFGSVVIVPLLYLNFGSPPEAEITTQLIFGISMAILKIITIFFSTMCSAYYINKKYVIRDGKRVLAISSFYFFLLSLVVFVAILLFILVAGTVLSGFGGTPIGFLASIEKTISFTDVGYSVTAILFFLLNPIRVAVFYISSKRYLVKDVQIPEVVI